MCTVSIQFYMVISVLSLFLLYFEIGLEIFLYGFDVFSIFIGENILLMIARILTFVGELGIFYFIVAVILGNISDPALKTKYKNALLISGGLIILIIGLSCISFFLVPNSTKNIILEKWNVAGILIMNGTSLLVSLISELLMLNKVTFLTMRYQQPTYIIVK